MEKTHYRKAHKSDHLGVADLEEFIEIKKPLIFTIKIVKQEKNVTVAGKRIDIVNIAYFNEPIKPLVLNAINGKQVRSFNKNSPFVQDWAGTIIELYIDYNVRMKGETVAGVRIKPLQPKPPKAKPVFTQDNFEKAKAAGASIEKIKTVYQVSPDTEAKYTEYVK
jgi:hypothetical protein